jgi:hypothetical protein
MHMGCTVRELQAVTGAALGIVKQTKEKNGLSHRHRSVCGTDGRKPAISALAVRKTNSPISPTKCRVHHTEIRKCATKSKQNQP